MPEESSKLLTLAQGKYASQQLSLAEEKLFRAAETGGIASAFIGDEKQDGPANELPWNPDRAIRGECIVWLCTDREASALVTHRGIEVHGAQIDGELNLGDADVKFPLWLWRCRVNDTIFLRDAQIPVISLQACHIKDLFADGVRVRGAVYLRHGFRTKGEVRFMGAVIGGNLDFEDAQLTNRTGPALSADSATIQGNVFLRNGFKAEGEVRLLGTTIGGYLDCTRADLSNPGGTAINAQSSKIEGHAFLRFGYRSEGKIDFLGATIRGGLVICGVVEPEKTILDLRLAKAGTFWDDDTSWPKDGHLFLDGFVYERLDEDSPLDAERRKNWLSRQPQSKFLPQPYEQLASVLREMGHDRDARFVMMQKNREQSRFTRRFRQGWWWYNAFGRAIGYGYAPWRAFAMSVVMILLGTFLFGYGSCCGLIAPTKESAYEKNSSGHFVLVNEKRKVANDYPVFNAFVYSLESFTPLLKLDQSGSWAPNANHGERWRVLWLWEATAGDWLRRYLWVHIIAGWILTTLWVGAVTGLVKT